MSLRGQTCASGSLSDEDERFVWTIRVNLRDMRPKMQLLPIIPRWRDKLVASFTNDHKHRNPPFELLT
jgi:hypothetical protein